RLRSPSNSSKKGRPPRMQTSLFGHHHFISPCTPQQKHQTPHMLCNFSFAHKTPLIRMSSAELPHRFYFSSKSTDTTHIPVARTRDDQHARRCGVRHMTQSALRITSIFLICAAATPVVAGPRGGGHFGGGVHFSAGTGPIAAPHIASPQLAAPHFPAPSYHWGC